MPPGHLSGIQLLLLGINAHIDYDLALALQKTGIDLGPPQPSQ